MTEFKEIKNIRQLSFFIDNVFLTSDEDKFLNLESSFKLFHTQIKAKYDQWFPKAKNCKDEDIAHHIYITEFDPSNLKNWVKYSMACLLNSSNRIFISIKQAKKDNLNDLFLSEIGLLYEMSFEAGIFMEIAIKIIENKDTDFGFSKRFSINASETFNASRLILRKYFKKRTHGEFVFSPSSIFLIRQSIELWLQSIFAIDYLIDEKGKNIKLQPEILFKLLDNKGIVVKLPVSKKAIQKIHSWTQIYVHAGIIAYTWEIEHAHNLLKPIFIKTNIVINKAHFDSVENQIKEILDSTKLKLYRCKNHDSTIE